MYITKEDLNLNLYEEIIDAVTRKDANRVGYGIKVAVQEIDSYLGQIYNTAAEFAKEGDDRHALVVNLACDLAIWHITSSLDEIPQGIADSFEHAVKTLEKIALGKMSLTGIPRRSESDQEDTFIRSGNINNRY